MDIVHDMGKSLGVKSSAVMFNKCLTEEECLERFMILFMVSLHIWGGGFDREDDFGSTAGHALLKRFGCRMTCWQFYR